MPTKSTSSQGNLIASALVPGVVIGEPDDGLINFVSHLRDVERGEVAGYNSRIIGGYRQLFPRLSQLDFEAIQVSQLPEVEGGLEDMVSGLRHLTEADKQGFLMSRRLVRQDMGNGKSRMIIVPKIPVLKSEVAILEGESKQDQEYDYSAGAVSARELAERRKSRKYSLAQLLTDHDVLPKYNLGIRAVETTKRIAATDPALAARMFQDLMNQAQSDVAVTVTSGSYSRDRTQACNAVRQLCKGVDRTDANVFSLVNMNKFFMFGPRGEGDWFVSGPLKYATEVSFVYWLVRAEGYIMPSVLLAMELVLLSIDVSDGETCEEPELTYHASLPDSDATSVGIPSSVSGVLSTSARIELDSLRERLLPVMGADSRQLATAVRVTGKHVLVNSHVLAVDAGCTIEGQKPVVRSQLSRDLWSVKLEGESSPWSLRDPRVGEQAIICYLAEGVISASSPLQVVSVDTSCVVTTLDDSVTHGMSGGALIALSDFSLLGVHSASTLTNLLSYRFGAKQFSELLESDSASAFSRQDDLESFAADVADHFKRKGLWKVMATALDSIEPVYSEHMHVGMIMNNGGHAYTACDPELPLRVGEDRRVAKFETVVPNNLYRTVSQSLGTVPVYRRNPEYFEKVFIIGTDGEPYISAETRVMHVGPDARNFVIADLKELDKPVSGGLVMAWDGAVLGVCGRRSFSTAVGLGFICFPVAREEPIQVAQPRECLARAFPFLNMAAWTDELLEEIFTHSSVGHYASGRTFNAGCKPLANIGDNVAKAELYKSLRECSVPHSQWSVLMQSLQSNSNYAKVAWNFGFARALIVGNGVSMQQDAKAYADLTEALIGAASLLEHSEVVRQLCLAMAIVYTAKPSLGERSVSDFGGM